MMIDKQLYLKQSRWRCTCCCWTTTSSRMAACGGLEVQPAQAAVLMVAQNLTDIIVCRIASFFMYNYPLLLLERRVDVRRVWPPLVLAMLDKAMALYEDSAVSMHCFQCQQLSQQSKHVKEAGIKDAARSSSSKAATQTPTRSQTMVISWPMYTAVMATTGKVDILLVPDRNMQALVYPLAQDLVLAQQKCDLRHVAIDTCVTNIYHRRSRSRSSIVKCDGDIYRYYRYHVKCGDQCL